MLPHRELCQSTWTRHGATSLRCAVKKNYDNAAFIATEMGLPLPKVKTWELLNKSFSFPRIRRFETVQEQMDLVEHFQDNLNLNLTNSVAVENFIRSGKAAVAAGYQMRRGLVPPIIQHEMQP